jgi:HlyD family secretion protein
MTILDHPLSSRFRSRPFALAGAGVVAALVLFGVFAGFTSSAGRLDLESVEVARGDVRRIVSTSGAVRALVTVDVGSQLSGQIAALEADFNSVVQVGDVIARLDPQTYETRVREAEAALVVAQSQVQVQEANVTRAQANLRRVENEYARAEELVARGTASQAAYDTALSNVEAARADLLVAQAGLVNANATLGQRQAALDSSRIDLDRTLIRSPIDGIVVSRVVNVGQTVAASMQAPVLFTIAEDLTRVQIDAQVDEADIGQVQNGQPVSFTVDAYPDSEFRGEVEQTRLAALAEANVVTYTVVISANNPGRRLLPGMTANVDIVTGAREDVLTVDNRALRFEPRGAAEALLTGRGREVLAALREDDNNGPPGFVVIAGGGPPPDFQGGFNGGGGGGGDGRGWGGRNGGLVNQLRDRLDLTEAQVEQVQTAMRASFAGFQGGGDGEATPDREAIRTRIATSIESVLTPEQRERYRELQSELEPGRRVTAWVVTGSGQLEPRSVTLGVEDSQVTEIVGGELQEGDRVVVRVRERSS